MDKKQSTENLISESFKSLLLKYPFDKITIKMITDKAGIIRPTFYNYFQDKYELLEWYLKNDVMSSVENLISNNMVIEAVKMIFIRFDKNKLFYQRAFEVTGQNSFESILTENFVSMFLEALSGKEIINVKNTRLFSKENISRYYANGLVYIIKTWLDTGCIISSDELLDGFVYMMTHTIEDIIKGP